MSQSPAEPNALLWSHALRAQVDAVIAGFEVQVRQAVAVAQALAARDADAFRDTAVALQARLDAAEAAAHGKAAEAAAREAELAHVRARVAQRESEIADLHTRLETTTQALATAEATVARLETTVAALGHQVQSLDEQFAVEKRWVLAALGAVGTALFDAAQLALGQPVEATPASYAALKARKPDAVLAQALRDRGRTAGRMTLTETERVAMKALAEASGCELVEPTPGARFTAAAMEKCGTRPEPSEEDLVLETVVPGLRLAGTSGSLVHPRVIVGTA